MFKKLRNKLLAWAAVFIMLTVSVIIISYIYHLKRDKIADISYHINTTYLLIQKLFREQKEFLNYETTNPDFYIDGESIYLQRHNTIFSRVQTNLDNLTTCDDAGKFKMNTHLQQLSISLDRYKSTFDTMVKAIYKRGYKNWGIVGKMRDEVHALEAIPDINKAGVLTLRRHEKDYIIRNEAIYINKLKNAVQVFRQEIRNSRKIGIIDKKEALLLLDNYREYFNELTSLNDLIGIRNHAGLKYTIEQQEQKLESNYTVLINRLNSKKERYFTRLNIYYFASLAVIIVLSLIISWLIARNISTPVAKLTKSINTFIRSNFSKTEDIHLKSYHDELGILTMSYKILIQEISNHLKNQETRQQEIAHQKEEINRKNTKLLTINKELERKNAQITSSINYAKFIQESILPSDKILKNLFPESFILFKPKDIVSGDFYWFYKHEEKLFIIASDCTGHGVPGAFMAMIGNTLLNNIITEKKISCPALILEELNKDLKFTLNRNDSTNPLSREDGMDISICVIDSSKKQIEAASANQKILIINNNEKNLIKGDLFSIGVGPFSRKESEKFTRHTIKVEKGTTIYMFSDGFQDQFGGSQNMKFMSEKFITLLGNISSLNMHKQQELLETTFQKWKGCEKQIDDVLVIGIRVDESIIKLSENEAERLLNINMLN